LIPGSPDTIDHGTTVVAKFWAYHRTVLMPSALRIWK